MYDFFFISDCSCYPTNNKDITLLTELITLAVLLFAAVSIGLIIIVIICFCCKHMHRIPQIKAIDVA